MALPKSAFGFRDGESVDVHVYDIATKKIVFTGSQRLAAQFLGMKQANNIQYYLKSKGRYKKKYAIRYVSDQK
jgi:hypothetical protein